MIIELKKINKTTNYRCCTIEKAKVLCYSSVDTLIIDEAQTVDWYDVAQLLYNIKTLYLMGDLNQISN